ncbi:alpha/beta fold hydrolase [Microbacterium sp. NPDC057659]|uniref:alpha/beta fold hydrolase n=1 Tax=Microbacterium sp. NPDC057659 TaxID=3346198 RepID=UPI00366F6D9E
MTTPLLTTRIHPGPDPVLLIHGLASNGTAEWERTGFVAALAAVGRGAIVVDLPGHGAGPALARGAATTSDLGAALGDLIAESGQEQGDVIGYSMGARLAWAVAGTGRVRRLVLGALSPMDPFGALDVDALQKAVGGAAPSDPMVGMFAQMLRTPGLDAAAVVGLIDALHAEPFDFHEDVPAVPTLFLAGVDDQMSQGAERLADAVPGSQLVRVPGDHFAAVASPEFRDQAVAFVAA